MTKEFPFQNRILIVIFSILFLIPILNLGNNYIVGGDDMKLYYIFPELYLRNFSFNLISDNTLAGALTGYASVSYFAPFYFVIYVLKFIPLNTQALMYGLNFAFSFLFFYKLLGLYIESINNDWKVFWSKILASIFFIFSPFLSETLYSHQLMFIYLVSVLPSTLYFFIKSVRLNDTKSTLISLLIFSIFSTTYASLPVSAAFLITIIPILIYEFYLNKIYFIKQSLIWGVGFIGLNFYWLIHLAYGIFHNTGLVNSVDLFSSGVVKLDNIRIITGVAKQYSPLNQVFVSIKSGIYQVSWQDIVRSIFLIIILIGGILVSKLNKRHVYSYSAILIGLLIAWFLFSPNFGDWGPRIFISITNRFPLFGMFRNMQDKFALPLAFFYALSFGIGLSIVVTKIKNNRIVTSLLFVISLILLINIPRILNPNIPDRDGLSRVSGKFNSDFLNLVEYIKSIDDSSRVMWLPLNFPTYSNVQDNNGNFYSGLSPIRILANKSDFAGKFSFLTQNDVYLGDKVLQWLKEGNYQDFGKLAQQLNIKYIVVDHQSVPLNLQSFYYGGEGLPILKSQNDELSKEIIGDKVGDFGNKYSLYTIKDEYDNSKIFFFNSAPIKYKKISSSEYQINVVSLNKNTNLGFLDPYNSDWTLYLTKEGKEIPYKKGENKVLYNYANEWEINVDDLKNNFSQYITTSPDGKISFDIKLYFEPDKLNSVSLVVSGLFLISCILLITLNKRK